MQDNQDGAGLARAQYDHHQPDTLVGYGPHHQHSLFGRVDTDNQLGSSLASHCSAVSIRRHLEWSGLTRLDCEQDQSEFPLSGCDRLYVP